MAKIYVHEELLEELMRQNHLNKLNLAQRIGMNRSTVCRALGGNPVGEKFIAGIMGAFPQIQYGELFFCSKRA